VNAAESTVVHCPACGRDCAGDARFCFCGVDLRAAPQPPLIGVRGWLLFFCIQIAILAPPLTLLNVSRELLDLVRLDALLSRVGAMILLDSASRLTLAAIGVVAGVSLWLRRQGAVAFVRVYLLAYLGVYLLLIALPYVCALPAEVRGRVAAIYFQRAAIAIPSTIVWSLYFRTSRRVRDTYAAAAGPSH